MGENAGKVMTVLGPVNPEELGHTLPHEHTLTYLTYYATQSSDPEVAAEFKKSVTLDNLYMALNDFYCIEDNCIIQDKEFLIKELKRFKAAGGGTVCDLTLEDITKYRGANDEHYRNVKELSERSGVHIVCSVGDYVSDVHLPRVKELTVEQLAQVYIDTINNGFGTSEVKPGQVGELGVGNDFNEDEHKVLAAGVIACKETGLSMNVHINSNTFRNDFAILDWLEDHGMDLTRVGLSHRDATLANKAHTFEESLLHLEKLMDRGAYVLFDSCGNLSLETAPYAQWANPSDRDRAIALRKLIDRGYNKQLMLSMDASQRHRYTSYGGYCYTHILKRFREWCKFYDITDAEYEQMIVKNPQTLLTIK